MNEHEIETARALVASPHFAWQPAMIDTLGRRVLETSMDPTSTLWVRSDTHGWLTVDLFNAPLLPEGGFTQALPYLSDDGTRGALEGLACRLWGDPGLYALEWWCMSGGNLARRPVWRIHTGRGRYQSATCGVGETKGEAWARAVMGAKSTEEKPATLSWFDFKETTGG
jgi:hypothetical protein